jgi:hypothetical protein
MSQWIRSVFQVGQFAKERFLPIYQINFLPVCFILLTNMHDLHRCWLGWSFAIFWIPIFLANIHNYVQGLSCIGINTKTRVSRPRNWSRTDVQIHQMVNKYNNAVWICQIHPWLSFLQALVHGSSKPLSFPALLFLTQMLRPADDLMV